MNLSCQTAQKQITSLEKYSNEVQTPESLPEGQLGYFLYDSDSKTVLAHHLEDRSFIPASTTKVLSTVAALKILGPRYRFKTSVSYDGEIRNHILYGNLYLKGSGDPHLKAAHLMSLALAVAEKGIRSVSGHFYYDESLFISGDQIEADRESWAAFNTGVSALSSEFNQLSVHWFPLQASDPSKQAIYSVPDFSFIQFSLAENRLPEETSFIYEKQGNTEKWLLSPKLVHGGKARLPIKHPGLATAEFFAKLCQLNRIELPQPESKVTPLKSYELATHQSIPLVELSEAILEYSNNLMAELIQLAAARELKGKAFNLEASASFIENWYLKNLNLSQTLHLKNGSGLNSQNRISPRQLVTVLDFANHSQYDGRKYETLLSIAGKKGDVSERLATPNTAFHVWAKTGTMDYSSAITGFLYTNSGKKLTFAIMATDFQARSVLEADNAPLSEQELEKTRAWGRKAKRVQDSLITQWIESY